MSIRIALDQPPEFYTNLDIINGRIILNLNRPETIGAVIVKLEGESRTALGVPADDSEVGHKNSGPSGTIIHENHKILYKVQQVFPDPSIPAAAVPVMLGPGQHAFPFRFKFPFNNACSDPTAMAKIGGFAGAGGFAGPSMFGLGGVRVMDGSKQLLYSHVTKTLPPSFTGFPREAEIRYYVKVTIQRPGLLKENWRYSIGLKFLPIEPPRPDRSNQEAYARRPFAFRPRSPAPSSSRGKRSSFFSPLRNSKSNSSLNAPSPSTPATPISSSADGMLQPPLTADQMPGHLQSRPSSIAPSIEMSARLPHPSILTCNKAIPLRLIAKKLVPAAEQVYLVSFQMDLIGLTNVRCQDLINTEVTRWVITAKSGLSIPVSAPDDEVGKEIVVPDTLWRDAPLPNTVMPSFITCNLARSYELELKVGLSWGPQGETQGRNNPFSSSGGKAPIAQEIHLPLHFSTVEIYSGVIPPAQLVEAMRQQSQSGRTRPPRRASNPARPTHATPTGTRPSASTGPSNMAPAAAGAGRGQQRPPALPTRPSATQPVQVHDPLYPPQLAPGQSGYDDAPPSYDEAMADVLSELTVADGARPAYSGMTNENAPSTLPEKS